MRTRPSRSVYIPLAMMAFLVLGGTGAGQPEKPSGSQPTQPAQPGGSRPEREAGSVESAMKEMNRAAKLLKVQVGDPAKKDANLQQIWRMQKSALQAKTLEPKWSQENKDKWLPGFRKDQIQLMRLLLTLEEEVMDDKTDQAKKTFQNVLDLRDKKHEEFGVKD